MGPALNKDLEALRAIDKDKVQANDKNETATAVAVLRRFYEDYASIARQLHDMKPPSYSTDAVDEWLRLFDQRGEGLYGGIEKLESDSILDRLQFADAMSTYANDTDKVLPRAKQLGVESCP
jgi:hypothetical protein